MNLQLQAVEILDVQLELITGVQLDLLLSVTIIACR